MYHSITFTGKIDGVTDPITVNTWDNWHLIPTSRPDIAHPQIQTDYQDIGGMDGQMDFTEYIPGGVIYGTRTGSLEFYVDNRDPAYSNWMNIRDDIIYHLHGRRLFMSLTDDEPGYYYYGRFSVSNWKSDQKWSTVTINYELDPFKRHIDGANINMPTDTIIYDDI